MLVRDVTLLDDLVCRSDAGGRLIVAYAAVFDRVAEIRDHEGHYYERINRRAFNRTLDHHPNGRGIKAIFNHGRTIHGVSSDRFSMPFGVPEEMKVDARGLYTVTRVANTELGDEVYELARDGAIDQMSFSAMPIAGKTNILEPATPGDLVTRERTELKLIEYGPVALAGAYGAEGAQITAVRSEDLFAQLEQLDEQDRADLLARFSPPDTRDGGTSDEHDSPDDGHSLNRQQRRLRLMQLKGLLP